MIIKDTRTQFRLIKLGASTISKRCGPHRSETAKEAILAATVTLLSAHGYGNLKLTDVAAEAGVGRQTIYRWWETKSALVLEVLVARLLPPYEKYEPSEPSKEYFKRSLWALAQTLERPGYKQAMVGLVAEAAKDPELRDRLDMAIFQERIGAVRNQLARAQELGNLRQDADLDTLINQTFGAIWYRAAFRNQPYDEAAISMLVDQVLAGVLNR